MHLQRAAHVGQVCALAAPGAAATAPALANAVFAATGTRVCSMPLKNIMLPAPV